MLAALALCQTSQEEETFEVASVKAVNPGVQDLPPGGPNLPFPVAELFQFRGGPGSSDPGRINYSGVTMRMLLQRAYRLRSDQIAGPNWIDDQRYEVTANVPPGSDDQRVRLMLRSLLTERFQVQLHREKKTMPIYDLVVAKGGPKLQPAETPRQAGDPKALAEQQHRAMAHLGASEPGHQRFHLPDAEVAEFINFLSTDVDGPVLDRTQLQGKFAFNLSYYRRLPGQDVPSGPSVFEAVKAQLGLELIPTKGDAELLVIDRANRLPASN